MAVSLSAQLQTYVAARKATGVSASNYFVTIQQPTANARRVWIRWVWVACSADCTAEARRFGALPDPTAFSPIEGDIGYSGTTATAYSSTDVGQGEFIMDYAFPASQVGYKLEFDGFSQSGLTANQAFTIDASTLTDIVVATNVGTATTVPAHGLSVGDEFSIRGEVGDTDLNADYTVVSVPSSTTFTFATVSVSDGTYDASGVEIHTTGVNFSFGVIGYTGDVRIMIGYEE